MDELTKKLQKAILDIQLVVQTQSNYFLALGEVAKICNQLKMAGDLAPRTAKCAEPK